MNLQIENRTSISHLVPSATALDVVQVPSQIQHISHVATHMLMYARTVWHADCCWVCSITA